MAIPQENELIKEYAQRANKLGKNEIYALTKILKNADVRVREVIATILGKCKRLEAVDVLCDIVIKDVEQGVRTTGAISVLDIARQYKNNKKAIRYIINKSFHPILLAGSRYSTARNIQALGWVFMELVAIGDKIAVLTGEDKNNLLKALAKYYQATLNAEARKAIQKIINQLGATPSVAPAITSG